MAFAYSSSPRKKTITLFNRLSFAFDQLLAKVTGNPGIVPLVVRSGSEDQADVEDERPRETGHAMTLRSLWVTQDYGDSIKYVGFYPNT